MASKKTKVENGFTKKPKTLEEVNQEYANLAATVGHKALLIANTGKQIEELNTAIANAENDVKDSLEKMNVLQRQGQEFHRKAQEEKANAVAKEIA